MEELKSCIASAVNPNSNAATREMANRQLYSFQNEPNSILVCLEAFAHPDRVDTSLLSFLLNVAKTQIILFHDRWSADVRTPLRQSLLKCFVLPAFAQNKRSCEKMAQILVELIIREWPQLWPDAFDFVYGMLHNHSQIGLLLLSYFLTAVRSEAGEEVVGGWSGERKGEVTGAFNEVLPGICQWLHTQQSAASPDPAIVMVYGQLASWARLDEHDKFVDWCLDLIPGSAQEEAVEALSELSNRPFNPTNADDLKLIEYLLGKGLRKFNVLLENAVGANYFLFRQLIDIITSILSKLCNAERNEQLRIKIDTAILDLQLYLSHPSLYVRSVLVMCILDVFKAAEKCALSNSLLDEAIEQAMPLLIAILAEDPNKTFKTMDNQSDFEEYSEFLKVQDHLKGRIGDVVEKMSKCCSETFMKLLNSQSMKLVGGGSSGVKWQISILFLIQHGLVELSPHLPSICNRVVSVLQQNIVIADFKLVEEALYALKALCLAIHTLEMYSECFKVFSHFATVQSEEGLSVRCRAMTCLYQSASAYPSLFQPMMPVFLNMVSAVKGQRELRTWIETVILMAGQDTFDLNVRMEYFKAVFVPLLAQIETASCRYLTEGSQFIEYTGLSWYLNPGSHQAGEPEKEKMNRIALANTLTLIQVTAKGLKGKSVDKAVSDTIARTFIPALLNVLDLLCSAQRLVAGHPNYHFIFEDAFLISFDTDDELTSEQKSYKYFNNWYSHIRTICYLTMGYFSDYEYSYDKLLVGFDQMKHFDRASMCRNALTPLFKTSALTAAPLFVKSILEYCHQDFKQPMYYDSEHKHASEWLAVFTSFTCDILFKKDYIKRDIRLYADILPIIICCIQNSAPPLIISKWANFVTDHIDQLSRSDEVLHLLFTDLTVACLEAIPKKSSLHPQLVAILFDLFKANARSDLYQVDHLLVSQARMPGPEVDRLRSLVSTDAKLKTAKSALQSSLQPLIRLAKSETSTVKKPLPDKLVILSKLRKLQEQEEIENMAISDAADLFNNNN